MIRFGFGAYYKFIKNGDWRKYDYVFFIQEGAILLVLTRSNLRLTLRQRITCIFFQPAMKTMFTKGGIY